VRQVTSQALDIVAEVLGLGRGGAPETQFEDGTLQQTLEVSQLVRRGKTLADSQGLWAVEIANVHVGASTINTNHDPYALASGVELAPYPTPIPRGFDFWLLYASVISSGAGLITAATVNSNWPVAKTAFVAASATFHVLAAWDGDVLIGTLARMMDAGGEIKTIHQKIGVRIPRGGTTIGFASVSSAAGTATLQMVVGLFPAGLGQDGLV